MRITCPACGLNMELPGDHAWGMLNCVECGKRIRFGEPPGQTTADDIDFDFSAVSPPAAGVALPIQPRRQRQAWLAAGVGAMGMAMLVVLLIALERAMAPVQPAVVAPSIAWDQSHRGNLLQLKASADRLITQARWQQAYDAYQQILLLVADHEVKDPVALMIVQAVRPGQEQAMAGLTSDRARPVIATEPPPAYTIPALTARPTTQAVAVKPSTTQATTTAVAPTSQPSLTAAEMAADNAPPLAGVSKPLTLHAYTLANEVSDEQIGQAIDKGVAYLAGQFRSGEIAAQAPVAARANPIPHQTPRGAPPSDLDHASDLDPLPPPPSGPEMTRLPDRPVTPFRAPAASVVSTPGIDALCVYALLNGGRAQDAQGLGENDPLTQQILDRLKQYDMPFTYHRSLRAAALGVFHRTQDNAALEEDARWLQAAHFEGAYTYEMPQNPQETWDNSNSQYGLLGVWSAAQAGIAVSDHYWRAVEQHWINCGHDGLWGYNQSSQPTLTMTCAGIASLLVARDYLDASDIHPDASRQSPALDAINAGLQWLETGDHCMDRLSGNGMGGAGYGLYGLERVGLASGFKYFGQHDWYAELAKRLVAQQHLDGSWGGDAGQAQRLIDTSYALLFLARGRHPILYNKLRYEGDWNNRPHDVAHLARYASQQLEKPLNWQVVNLRRDWFDWLDCPVLYLSGDKPLNLTVHDEQSLRDYANAGGLIFTHADGGSPPFTRWVEQLARRIFPGYELMQVPRDHPIYSTVYQIKSPQPLLGISNGSRLLLIHSPTDLAGGWQLNWTDEKKPAFEMGINLFVYAAGKANLKNRLLSSYIPEDPDRPDGHQSVAVLTYPGAWNPEPYAWSRFSRYFQWETHQQLELNTVEMKSLMPGSAPLAVLTGTVACDFTNTQAAAVAAYVANGGVLLIDACGGQRPFANSIEQTLLPKAFPQMTPLPLSADHPLLLPTRAHADDLTRPLLRSFASEKGGKDLPILNFAFGKGWVIYSRLDVTTGLLGTQSWGIRGFSPAYAQALIKNAVLWAAARSAPPDKAAPLH